MIYEVHPAAEVSQHAAMFNDVEGGADVQRRASRMHKQSHCAYSYVDDCSESEHVPFATNNFG